MEALQNGVTAIKLDIEWYGKGGGLSLKTHSITQIDQTQHCLPDQTSPSKAAAPRDKTQPEPIEIRVSLRETSIALTNWKNNP